MNNPKRLSLREQLDQEKKEEKRRKSVNFNSFLIDIKRNPMILIGLGGSALFTALAGLFIGVAPHRADGTITFFAGSTNGWSIAIGIFFGILYMLAFPVLGEFGVYYWHKRASLRDPGNKWQAGIGYFMLTITAIFMLITAVGASTILVSLLGSFTMFYEIPKWTQVWTVTIIPIGLGLNAMMNIWYDHKSKAAEERRLLERTLEEKEIESEHRIRQARVQARETAAVAAADEYEAISTVEAREAGKSKAKRMWENDREEMGADKPAPVSQEPSNAKHPAPAPETIVKEKPMDKPITRSAPIYFKSAINWSKAKVGDELQAIRRQDGIYNISFPGDDMAFAEADEEMLQVLKGEIVTASNNGNGSSRPTDR